MPLIVGVQAIVLCTFEILGMPIHQRIKATKSIEVDDRDSPEIASLFDRLDIGIKVLSALVGIIFTWLPITLVGIEFCAMNGGEQCYLLGGIETLHIVECLVDATTIG